MTDTSRALFNHPTRRWRTFNNRSRCSTSRYCRNNRGFNNIFLTGIISPQSPLIFPGFLLSKTELVLILYIRRIARRMSITIPDKIVVHERIPNIHVSKQPVIFIGFRGVLHQTHLLPLYKLLILVACLFSKTLHRLSRFDSLRSIDADIPHLLSILKLYSIAINNTSNLKYFFWNIFLFGYLCNNLLFWLLPNIFLFNQSLLDWFLFNLLCLPPCLCLSSCRTPIRRIYDKQRKNRYGGGHNPFILLCPISLRPYIPNNDKREKRYHKDYFYNSTIVSLLS